MNLISWNVNGIRAIAERGLSEWLADASPDVMGSDHCPIALELDLGLL